MVDPLSYVNAVPVLIPRGEVLNVIMVGCGGSGSWLAPHVARLAACARDMWREVRVTFCDPDSVEEADVPRQHFCCAEVGRLKAETLAIRYSAAWGLAIRADTRAFDAARAMRRVYSNHVTIIIGCVDNAAARREIAQVLADKARDEGCSRTWWLDCGNGNEAGQVLLGSVLSLPALRDAFHLKTQCARLPSPALQHPELLEPRPEELAGSRLSCAEMALANAQSLSVNQQVAAVAADYLVKLLFGRLTRFATYFDLASGSARSRYITPGEVAAAVGQPPEDLFGSK
ncbi:MAG: ThiF family adenylyltransferase [Anaerolineae bacterium]|nr:ThiF family adenylyltransferase [Anaerolineae bacterium]